MEPGTLYWTLITDLGPVTQNMGPFPQGVLISVSATEPCPRAGTVLAAGWPVPGRREVRAHGEWGIAPTRQDEQFALGLQRLGGQTGHTWVNTGKQRWGILQTQTCASAASPR